MLFTIDLLFINISVDQCPSRRSTLCRVVDTSQEFLQGADSVPIAILNPNSKMVCFKETHRSSSTTTNAISRGYKKEEKRGTTKYLSNTPYIPHYTILKRNSKCFQKSWSEFGNLETSLGGEVFFRLKGWGRTETPPFNPHGVASWDEIWKKWWKKKERNVTRRTVVVWQKYPEL